MTAEEQEFLEERVAIAVEHLPEAEAQAIYNWIVSRVAELPSCEISTAIRLTTDNRRPSTDL